MNNSKGFTLIEVMTALLIVTVMTAVLLPILVTMYHERLSIRQEEGALFQLEMASTNWIYRDVFINEETVEYENTSYTLTMTTDNQELKTCISWIGVNKRLYERCAYRKK